MSQEELHESLDIELDLSSDEINDWGGEGGWKPPEVLPGEYKLDILGARQHTAKSSGNSSLKVTFAVAEGEYAGKELVGYYALAGKAVSRLKRLMMCVGARLDRVRTDEIVGNQILATVTHDPMSPQKNPDGTIKTNPSTGEPYETSYSAKVMNERKIEAAKTDAKKTAAPPVTRGAATTPAAGKNNQGATRRA